jgi:3-methyladenine DNA glycosylase AlkD
VTLKEAMAALEGAGDERFRKTWARHGAPPPIFGVPYADIYRLQKRIGTDTELAGALWKTGNHDARILAALVVDPEGLTRAEIDRWIGDARYRILNDAVAGVAGRSPDGVAVADALRREKDEWRTAAGWTAVGVLAAGDAVAGDWLSARIKEIERGIAKAPNYTRHCMNNALIAIGGSRPALAKLAIAAAERIGKVEVDHGDSSCKTPDAAAYILKMAARKPARKKAPTKPKPAKKKAASRP